MTTPEPKPASREKRPPEPTFFDEPKTMLNLKPLNLWFKKHWFVCMVVGAVLAVLILPTFLSPKRNLRTQRIATEEEKREDVSRESMEQAIEQASANKKTLIKPIQRQ